MSKEWILKQLNWRIKTIQKLSDECIELIYKAGYKNMSKLNELEIEKFVPSEQTVYGKEVWNKAIEAAAKIVVKAPIFPKKSSPMADGALLIVLDIIEKEIRKLKK